MKSFLTILALALSLGAPARASDPLALGPEELVATIGGALIAVHGYSVPSLADWNNDGLDDLVVGEGGGGFNGKVRVYLNVGSARVPRFASYFYAQAGGVDLLVPGSGCMGAFPRVVQWDGDGRKDLVVGRADGRIQLFSNINTDADPRFGPGIYLEVGAPGAKVPIAVGMRATLAIADWDGDGDKDLVVGAYDGKLHLFLNEGANFAPDFRSERFVSQSGVDLVVPGGRSSPIVRDLDGDGALDLLAGNTYGEVWYHPGPAFSPAARVESEGVAIDLPGWPRSRPSLCYWTGDSALDLLVGAADGRVHLYQGASCEIVLDADPAVASAGTTVSFSIERSSPGNPAVLALLDVSGYPCFCLLDAGIFGADYRWRSSYTVPPGLAGALPRLRAYAITMCGQIGASNDIQLTFQ